jgi:uncharacterized protein
MQNIHPSNSLIIDSGFWVALHNRRDAHHAQSVAAFDRYENYNFLTTWPVLAEASHLLYGRAGFNAQMLFLQNIEMGGSDIFHLLEQWHLKRIRELMVKYRDLPMDLADASLVILAEELGHGRILSTDQRDFNTYCWKNHEPFENLLLPNS